MTMNTKTTYLKGLGVAVIIGVLSVISAAPAFALMASVAITASPSTVCSGQPSHLTWSSTDATSIWIDQGVGSVLPYGDVYVYPTQTTTYTITGTNTTGGYAVASATVFVNGSCTTPTPTPTQNTVFCAANYGYANSGDLVTFTAWGGNGTYAWSAVDGTPIYGNGSSFSTRFYNQSFYSVNRTVAVTSGYQTVSCNVTVYAGNTWSPTPTPTIYPTAQLQLTETGRNITRGQSGEYTTVVARGADTLDIIVRTRSTTGSYLYNTFVTEQLPAGFTYINGSTTLNGYVTADGITSTGINIGTVSPFAESVIKFSVRVDSAYVPTWGTVTVNAIAQARADGITTRSVSLPIILGQNASIGTISQVKTGPADSLWMALMVALLATGAYAAYTRSEVFGRRMALAEVSTLTRTAGPNFLK